MKAAPLKGDCIVCQAPEAIRVAVNIAVWGETTIRSATYRADGVRAAYQASLGIDDEKVRERFRDLDPKTITRHADHIEEAWREVNPGEALRDNEVPVATDFGSVMDAGTRVGMKVLAGLEQLVDHDPVGFAALRTKEAIALSKLGLGAAGTREASRLKRNQQAIDVAAIFAASSGHVRPPDSGEAEDEATMADLRDELEEERKLLAAHAGQPSPRAAADA